MIKSGNNYRANAWLILRPWISGLLVFLLLGSCCFYIASQRYNTRKREQKQDALIFAEAAKSRLLLSLQHSLSATQSLTLIIDEDGIPHNFDSVAARLLRVNQHIDAIQLVPGGIIRNTYPIAGNEAAIGLNILTDSSLSREANRAIEKKQLFFAGPLRLRQGGLAVVGRLPVFIRNKFWGFTAVIIRMPTLLQAAGIDTSGECGYYFQLSKLNPVTKQVEHFLPIRKGFEAYSELSVSIPNGEWRLSVMPVNGYRAFESIIPFCILGFLLSLTAALFAVYLGKTPARLQKMVMAKTAELEKSEKRNKSIVNALPDMAFVVDKNFRFVDYNNPRHQKTYRPKEDFIGKTISEIFPPQLAKQFESYISDALAGKRPLAHSYSMNVGVAVREYEARYIAQNDEDVFVIVRDITETRVAEQRIRESEVKYRTLVEQAADGIFIGDLKGNVLVVNPAACKLSQYSEDEILTMNVREFTTQEHFRAMPPKFDEIAAGGTVTAERKLRKKNGEIVDVEVSAKIIAPDRFLAFVRDITERKKANMEILRSREDLRRLSNHIENIREEERLSIAREIHDDLGQQLTVVKMDVARLGKRLASNPGETDDFNRILAAINQMVDVVRRITTDLRPGLLDDLGLVAAIDWYCNDFSKRTGIKTSFIPAVVNDEQLPQRINVCVFRILQDTLTNVARHANAGKADVSLVFKDDQLVLLVEDNGKGFDANDIKEKKSLGIMGMRERAFMNGGSYNVYSSPGKGTIIEVVFPLNTQAVSPTPTGQL